MTPTLLALAALAMLQVPAPTSGADSARALEAEARAILEKARAACGVG